MIRGRRKKEEKRRSGTGEDGAAVRRWEMAASSSHLISTTKPFFLSSKPPLPLSPAFTTALALPPRQSSQILLVFTVTAKPTVLAVEKLGQTERA
ncbi:hypothetical protein LguiA_024757 [Lonicera macranthoides]